MVVMILIEDESTLLMLLKGYCRSVIKYFAVAIVIAIVGSRSGCSCCCCSGCTSREGRHGDKNVDIERVDVVDVDKGLLGITNKHNE